MITILCIGSLMMFPIIGGGITFYYSVETTKDVRDDSSRDF
jgi:hypothetical protein